MSIEDWRSKIDDIDRKLVELLNERSRCAIEIAKIKREQNAAVINAERETQVLANVSGANHGPLDDDALKGLFERIIAECVRVEHFILKKEQ